MRVSKLPVRAKLFHGRAGTQTQQCDTNPALPALALLEEPTWGEARVSATHGSALGEGSSLPGEEGTAVGSSRRGRIPGGEGEGAS